jgi:hypothetical protein
MLKNLLIFVACAMSLSGSFMKSHCSKDGVKNANAYETQAHAMQEQLLDDKANPYDNPLVHNELPPPLYPAYAPQHINGEGAPLHVDANLVALNEGVINLQEQLLLNNPAPIVQPQIQHPIQQPQEDEDDEGVADRCCYCCIMSWFAGVYCSGIVYGCIYV